MAVTESPPRTSPAAPVRPTSGRAFGLELVADFALPALRPPSGSSSPRRASCWSAGAAELAEEWRTAGWTQDVELRHPDGRLFLGIKHRPDAGYLIWAPHHGRHLVSADGRIVRSAVPHRAPLAWQRLFFAQALPLAALLQGLEVLHASAVAVDGGAVAFTAASGTGKSSLAAHLVAAGATFLTDDVLALDVADGVPLAHPGPARASVEAHELDAMTAAGRSRLGRRVGATDKPHVDVPGSSDAVPLRALYRLSRTVSPGGISIREQVPPEPRHVLSSSFLPYVRSPARLLNQLATCAALVSSVRVFDVEIPPGAAAEATAEALLEHVHAEELT